MTTGSGSAPLPTLNDVGRVSQGVAKGMLTVLRIDENLLREHMVTTGTMLSIQWKRGDVLGWASGASRLDVRRHH